MSNARYTADEVATALKKSFGPSPEQKVIIFCNREIHADRVAQQMNNLYVHWCKANGQTPKDLYAFKCMGGTNNGADLIEPMRGSGERVIIDGPCLSACTMVLGVIPRELAQPLADTLKFGPQARVAATVPRDDHWLAQTPQMFRLGALRERLAAAGPAVTDEASAFEAAGQAPRLVPGSPHNIKVTWPEDFALAEALLTSRKEAAR